MLSTIANRAERDPPKPKETKISQQQGLVFLLNFTSKETPQNNYAFKN